MILIFSINEVISNINTKIKTKKELKSNTQTNKLIFLSPHQITKENKKINNKINNKDKEKYNQNPKILLKNIKFNHNSFGKKVNAKTILNKKPWKVTRCDQIVITKRKIIPNHEDLTKRKTVVFTITAYYINLFSENNPDKLIQSILFTDSKILPKMQRGAEGCIKIDGGKFHKSMIICGDNKKEGEYLLAAIRKFHECRGGLKKPQKNEAEKYKNVMRACGINSGFTNPKVIKKKIKEIKNKRKIKRYGKKYKNYYYKGFLHTGYKGVPGTY
jgi:hypothetical protein